MVKIVRREKPPRETPAGLETPYPHPDDASTKNPHCLEIAGDAVETASGLDSKKSCTSTRRRRIVACIAGVVVAIGLGDQCLAPVEAFAQKPTLKPIRKAKCSPNTRLLFTLQGSRTVRSGKTEEFILTAKRCPGKSKKPLEKIKVVGHNSQGEVVLWKINRLPKGEKRQRTIKLSFPEVNQGKKNIKASANPRVVVNASGLGGKHIGSGQWQLKKKKYSRKFAPPTPAGDNEPCTPRPDFRTGIQDDAAFVWQKYGSRDDAFRLAKETFPGVNILRINLLYNEVKATGYQEYIDTVIAAKRHGFSVYATLMPTPAYKPEGDHTLSYANEDPEAMRTFAQEAAAALGLDVSFFEIGNEPQHPLFSAFLDLDHYKAMAVAGLSGVRTSNKSAKVIFGGLAPNESSSIIKWLRGLQGLSNGVSLHPYGSLINEIREYAAAAGSSGGRPLYLSEYGNNRDSNQMPFNRIAAERARCAGAAALIYYLLYDKLDNADGWHTGIYPVKTAAAT